MIYEHGGDVDSIVIKPKEIKNIIAKDSGFIKISMGCNDHESSYTKLSRTIKNIIQQMQLDDHELIKVRVLEASPQDHRECNQALEKNESFEVVQLIGKTLVLYRPRPENPTIQIPE